MSALTRVAELRTQVRVEPVAPAVGGIAMDALTAKAASIEARLADAATLKAQLQAALAAMPSAAAGSPRGRISAQRLEVQIHDLDVEMVQLQGELRATQTQIAQLASTGPLATPIPVAPTVLVPPQVPWFAGWGRDMSMVAMGFTVLVLAPIAFAILWRAIRRGGAPIGRREWDETEGRIRRIEEAVDAIAIEVERVSEGQRFLTRAFSEEARPLAVPGAQESKVRRD